MERISREAACQGTQGITDQRKTEHSPCVRCPHAVTTPTPRGLPNLPRVTPWADRAGFEPRALPQTIFPNPMGTHNKAELKNRCNLYFLVSFIHVSLNTWSRLPVQLLLLYRCSVTQNKAHRQRRRLTALQEAPVRASAGLLPGVNAQIAFPA